MQIEFLNALETVLRSCIISASSGSLAEKGPLEKKLLEKCLTHPLCDLSEIRIQQTPPVIESPFSCNVAFVLAATYKRAFGAEVPPSEFAQCLAEEWKNLGMTERFSLDLSSCGHVNVQPTREEKLRILLKIDQLTSDTFFRSAFDGSSLFAEQGNLGQPELFSRCLILPPASADLFTADERYRAYWRPICWEALCQKRKNNPEISRLLSGTEPSSCAESAAGPVAYQAPNKDEEARRMMLLALLADEELDAAPFLLGELSRQNVPWYLKRFRRDFSSWFQKAEMCFGAERSWESCEQAGIGPVLDAHCQHILSMRFMFRQALQARKPEMFLGKALEIMRNFYSVYNRPDVRDAAYFVKQRADALCFYSMMVVASRMIWFLLGLSRAHCSAASNSGMSG